VRAYAFLGPIYPTASLQDVRALVRAAQGAGASAVMVDRLNLRPGVWASVSRALGADPQLEALARRRLHPAEGEADFYQRVLVTALEEARSLGLEATTAF
jgi:DNA repair photolyase